MEMPSKNATVTPAVQNDSQAALKARIAAFEAAPPAPTVDTTNSVQPPVATAPVVPVSETVVTPPPAVTPPAEKQNDSLQQFKNKDGEVDITKIQQSTEHLQKKHEEVQAAISRYKSLQSETTKASQELKKLEGQPKVESVPPVAAPSPKFELPDGEIIPELRQQLTQDLEKDPIGTIVKLAKAFAKSEVAPVVSGFNSIKENTRNNELLSEVKGLSENGHPWLKTEEGFKLVQKVFAERPWLWNSATPYKDAIRFVDGVPSASESRTNPAPIGGVTPILGANSAVPPPSSTPTVSKEAQLESLGTQHNALLKQGRYAEARKVMDEMDKIYKGY